MFYITKLVNQKPTLKSRRLQWTLQWGLLFFTSAADIAIDVTKLVQALEELEYVLAFSFVFFLSISAVLFGLSFSFAHCSPVLSPVCLFFCGFFALIFFAFLSSPVISFSYCKSQGIDFSQSSPHLQSFVYPSLTHPLMFSSLPFVDDLNLCTVQFWNRFIFQLKQWQRSGLSAIFQV